MRLMIAHRVGVGCVLRTKLIFTGFQWMQSTYRLLSCFAIFSALAFTFFMDWRVKHTLSLFAYYSLYFMDQVSAHFSDFIGAIENCISFKMRKGFIKNCD